MSVAPANLTTRRAFTWRAPLLRRASDDRLVAGVRAGDDAAFAEVYDRHHRELLAFCRHMLGDHAEGEDALQYTFVAALRALRTDDRPIRLRPWLFAIARNRCLSMLRARRHAVSLDDVEPSVAGLAPDVERRADLRELLSDLRRLPDDQREALVLSELGALGHDEIADVLLVPREKVKALVFQAREHLAGWRDARGEDCRVIREELSTARGAMRRRAPIRRHLEVCDGCRAFDAEVRRQRAALGVLLPVVPGVGLKASVLTSALGLGGGAVAGAGAGGAGLIGGGGALGAAKGMAAKALIVTAVAGGAGTAGYVAVEEVRPHHDPPASQVVEAARAQRAARAVRGAVAPAAVVAPVATPAAGRAAAPTGSAGQGKKETARDGHGHGRDAGKRRGAGAGAAPHERGKGKAKGRGVGGLGHAKAEKVKGKAPKARTDKVKAEKVKAKARPERRAAAHVKPKPSARAHRERPAKQGAKVVPPPAVVEEALPDAVDVTPAREHGKGVAVDAGG